MSEYIPENMEEVAVQVAKRQVHGEKVTPEEVIEQAVPDILQVLLDDALEGRYDEVKRDGDQLIVTDAMGAQVGTIAPKGKSFVDDFKEDSDALIDYLESQVAKLVGGR
ncbi:MAG: hypothetical protein LKJ51_00040 [Limosilactobacillus sp.]|jgi:hypothetical protein|uniref:hypothetical protein n=1 Tax=Limosilactobacillus sp. TaxID=2773925 RepID=UPI0025C47049|nr:hypothetical protein [Limosilactobacillus sp.]MCI1974296.1 hypothetical protein [Limosilactobacillus sp.]MCI2030411.1 hypothetical protein [Limosilactobacillus sp.]